MLNCGPGNSCCGHCASMKPPVALDGYGGSQFPGVEKVLRNYIAREQAAGRAWYISPELNSDAYTSGDGLGILPIFATIAAAATKIGATVVAAAPKIASVVGTVQAVSGGGGGSSSSGPTAEDIAAAVTPAVQAQLKAQGVVLPGDVAQAASTASILDAFGTQNRPYVIAGAVGLGLLLLMTIMRR